MSQSGPREPCDDDPNDLPTKTPENPPFVHKATYILEQYLQPQAELNLAEALQKLLDLLANPDPNLMRARMNGLTTDVMNRIPENEIEPSDDVMGGLLNLNTDHCEFTDLVVKKARQIAYHDPAQIRLARLLCHLTPRADDPGQTWAPFYPLPGPVTRATQPHWETVNFRERLEYDSKICIEDSWSRSVDIDYRFPGHVNFHAFLAHLGQFGFFNMTHIAVCQLKHCFEESGSHGQSFRVGGGLHFSSTVAQLLEVDPGEFEDKLRTTELMAAAMWILFNGQRLFSEVVRSPKEWTEDLEKSQFVTGYRFTGPIFGIERWTLWREGFEAAARGRPVDDKRAGLLAKAANIMQVLEDSMWH